MSTLLIAALVAAAPTPLAPPATDLASLEVEKKRVCTESRGMDSRAARKSCRTVYYGADGQEISKDEAERRTERLEQARSRSEG
ncbi:hypothetical protein WJT74_03220 [Sphingomicrobium sp. XHP0239]|uniref:hypothetical protein n=1 Tax=Sphingomicrobium maritimum TaxID=3133972 RepID=UPI0031CC9C49